MNLLLKKNLHILLISIALVLWFYGVTGVIKILTKNSNKIEVYILLIFISLLIFFMDDYSLSELHQSNTKLESAAIPTILSA